MNTIGNLILVRGIPGSSKSTFATREYVEPFGYKLLEADMYFIKDGVYIYDADKISNAHDWCFSETAKALHRGENVIVANTFTKKWELSKYLRLNPSKIYRCTGNFKNVHNVPEDVVKRMKERFEDIEGEIII